MPPASDFGPMTDREILVRLATDMQAVKDAVYGPPSLSERLSRLETRVEERTTSKKGVAGIAGLAAAAIVAIVEAFRGGPQ